MKTGERTFWRGLMGMAVLAFLFFFSSQPVAGQSTCATAVPLNVSPAGATCASPVTATFGGSCSTTPVDPPCGSCSEAIWLQLNPVPPLPGQRVNLDFTIDFLNPVTGCYSYSLVYAEASDNGNGDPCSWFNNTPPASNRTFNIWEEGFSFNVGTAPFSLSFEGNGLDGTATYFLVLYFALGTTGGDVSVCAQLDPVTPYCFGPSYDTCANAISMTSGNGLDSGVLSGTGNGSWAEALNVTTRCASKVRMGNETLGINNEDHFSIPLGGGIYYPNATPGDDPFGVPFGITPSCLGDIENSIFIEFTPLAFATDYTLNFGDLNCNSALDSINVMVVDNLDCNDAANTTMIAGGCAQVGQTGLYPDPDFSLGPLTLNGGTSYHIIIDGLDAAQCDFQILLSRTVPNNVLVAGFVSATANPYGSGSLLEWQWANRAEVRNYRIERNHNQQGFAWIAEIGSDAHSYLDQNPPAGPAEYRISALGESGQILDQTRVQITQDPSGLMLEGVSFQKMTGILQVSVSSQDQGKGQLRMADLSGKTLYKVPIEVQQGSNRLELLMPDLQAGVYLAEIRLGARYLPIKLLVP